MPRPFRSHIRPLVMVARPTWPHLASVAAVANDRQGDTYVADFFNDAIRRIDAHSGVITTVAGEIPTSPIQQGHCC